MSNTFRELEDIQYVDLFPDWNKGLTRIFDTMRSQGIEVKQGADIQATAEWHLGLSEKDWRDLLSSIYRKKCIPFIGAGVYSVQTRDGKTVVPSSRDIVEKWKEKYRYPLEDLYELASIHKYTH